ncbi:MAG: hypothetical protein ACYCZF_10195 [Anaerolineae bacterium]
MMSVEAVTPLRWGFCDDWGPANLEAYPWMPEVVHEFGFNTWNMHYYPAETLAQDVEHIHRVDAWCAELGMQWLADIEYSNYHKQHIDSLGRDWYNRPDGRHYFLFPDDLLAELGNCKCLRGLVYDEAEHMQNCRQGSIDRPLFYDPIGRRLQDASQEFTAACREVVAHHARFGLKLHTESVFPIMLDCFARAGMTPNVKILKENWSPAYYAVALGAARQYGTELWITPDLWGLDDWYDNYPGHSVDEYRSALLMAYSLGADCIYTENIAHGWGPLKKGGLIRAEADRYEVTPYGAVARWFRQEYQPVHPRMYRWQDVRPRTAIIRQQDACWGQRTSWLPDSLFGNPEWRSDDVTEGWLRVFHLLSRGVIPPDTLSWHNTNLSSTRPYQLFCPLDGVIVYDHLVQSELLQGLEVLFLTGIGVSEVTLTGIRQAVRAGATCIGRPALLPEEVRDESQIRDVAEGAGRWIASETFLDERARCAVAPVLPREDKLTYLFGHSRITLRPIGGDPNKLDVETVSL